MARFSDARCYCISEATETELLALQCEAATDVRINLVKLGDRRVLREKFAGRGLKCHFNKLSPIGIRLEKRIRTAGLPEWKNGLFEYQDEARSRLRCATGYASC